MKKMRIWLWMPVLVLLCCGSRPGSAAADTLAAPFPAGSPESVLARRIAETLEYDYTPEAETASLSGEGRAEAANRMLAEKGTLLCDTSAVLMAGLQGYTAEDLRTAMIPVCRVARCPLYLVIGEEAARERGIDDGKGLMAFLAENEYDEGLLLARHVEADPEDRAAVFLAEHLPLLTAPFWPEEIPAALESGGAALAVCTEAEVKAAGEGTLRVLFTLGSARTAARPEVPALTEAGLEACPEPALYLMTAAGTAEDTVSGTAGRIAGAALEEACRDAGFCFDPLSGPALAEEIAAVFADDKAYMTAEGLFFYEE